MKMEKVLLTDFSTPRWKGVKINSVKKCLKKLQQEILESGYLMGELKVDGYDGEIIISLSNVVHKITNIFLQKKCIYGDVEFMKNPNAKYAKLVLKNGGCFGIRGIGESSDRNGKGIVFHEIITWDVIS